MPTIAQKPNMNRVLPTEGTHIARVIGFIYMGTLDDEYMGVKKKLQKIRLTFELPEELHVFKEGDDAKPLVHSQEYTLSMGSKSNLRPIVEGIIGTSLMDEEAYGFNLESLIGLTCLVSLKKGKTAKGSDYVKISSTSKLMKGQSCKPAFNDYKILNYEDKWDKAYFDALPSFIKEKMEKSDEYMKLMGKTKEIDADAIPF